MKLLFLTNNDISQRLVDWLIHSAHEDVEVLNGKISMELVESKKPEFLISYNYRFIIGKDVLDIFNRRAINLHISYLPWNRGASPNIWSFLDETPKGVTIHLLDKGIDSGDILARKKVNIDEDTETLSSSYLLLNNEMQELFITNWGKIKYFKIPPRKQPRGGSSHRKNDFDKIKGILGSEGWNIKVSELVKRYKEYQNENN